MNPLQISNKGDTHEITPEEEEDYIPESITASSSSRSDDENDFIPGRITTPRSSRSRRSAPKTPKTMAGLENSDNDIEPGLDIKNIEVPSLQDTPGKVIQYIKEITSLNIALMMKVKSLNGYVHVLNAKEDDILDKGTHLRKTVKELTEELENYKISRRQSNRNSLKSGPKFDKTTGLNRKVTKVNRKSKTANTQLIKNREPKNGKNQKTGRIETTTVTQKPHDTKRPKAVSIPQKTSITVNMKSKEHPATTNAKSKNITKSKEHPATTNAKSKNITTKKTLNTKSLKESVVSQNTSNISKSNEGSEQGNVDDNKILLADTSKISKSVESLKPDGVNKISLADISKLTECSKQDDDGKKTMLADINSISVSNSMSSRYSSSAREKGTARTRTTSSSTIHTEFSSQRSLDRSRESLSTSESIEEELSIYSCSSPELDKLLIHKGGQEVDKAVHSTSTPDVPQSVNKISSVNSTQTIIKNIKRQGLQLPSLIEYSKINSRSSATPPKIRSSSSVFESPQRRFEMAKKVGATPLPSLPGLFTPKPPASPRPNTRNIKLPSLQSQTRIKRWD